MTSQDILHLTKMRLGVARTQDQHQIEERKKLCGTLNNKGMTIFPPPASYKTRREDDTSTVYEPTTNSDEDYSDSSEESDG